MSQSVPQAAASVVILGSGPAGLTAAIYAARANLQPIVLGGPQPGGQLTTTSEVENFPGFPDGIDGYELISRMQQQAEKFGAQFQYSNCTGISIAGTTDRNLPLYNVHTDDETAAPITTKTVIIATGATPKMTQVPGESKYFGGKGVSTCATCDGAFYKSKVVAIIGGGDSACEEALFLTRFASKVYLIHRRDELRASKVMQERVLTHPNIFPVWNHVPVEMVGNGESLTALKVKHVATGQEQRINVDGIFVAIGHTPNTEAFITPIDANPEPKFLSKTRVSLPHHHGYINGSATATTEQCGIFVAGDCADEEYRQAITAAATGCMAAINAERYLT